MAAVAFFLGVPVASWAFGLPTISGRVFIAIVSGPGYLLLAFYLFRSFRCHVLVPAYVLWALSAFYNLIGVFILVGLRLTLREDSGASFSDSARLFSCRTLAACCHRYFCPSHTVIFRPRRLTSRCSRPPGGSRFRVHPGLYFALAAAELGSLEDRMSQPKLPVFDSGASHRAELTFNQNFRIPLLCTNHAHGPIRLLWDF